MPCPICTHIQPNVEPVQRVYPTIGGCAAAPGGALAGGRCVNQQTSPLPTANQPVSYSPSGNDLEHVGPGCPQAIPPGG